MLIRFIARRTDCFTQYGIASDGIRLTDFAIVRTYRIINDQRWGIGDVLDTTRRDVTAMGEIQPR